jgi:hypothetical protein
MSRKFKIEFAGVSFEGKKFGESCIPISPETFRKILASSKIRCSGGDINPLKKEFDTDTKAWGLYYNALTNAVYYMPTPNLCYEIKEIV